MVIEKSSVYSRLAPYFLVSIILMSILLVPFNIQAESKKAFKLLEKGDYAKLIELLDKSQEYRCCPIDEEEFIEEDVE